MHDPAARDHDARFRRVLDYIDRHLDEPLDVERLSRVAAFSKFHFHRQFALRFGVGVHRYVQLVRLTRASHRLAFRQRESIMQIALASGYEAPEAFARAFRKDSGQSPSAFREAPRWDAWHAASQVISQIRSTHMTPVHTDDAVRIVDFPETRVACLVHRGDPRLVGESIRRFIDWRKQNRLPPAASRTFVVAWNDPETVAPADYRLDLCAATAREIADNAFGVSPATLPGGRCAWLRHTGSDATLRASVAWLYRQWLPASGYETRDAPLFFERVRFFPDVAEHEAVTDIFLPLGAHTPAHG